MISPAAPGRRPASDADWPSSPPPTASDPSGTVTFYGRHDGAAGTSTLAIVGGDDQATFTTSSLAVPGDDSLTVAYAGDDNDQGSTSAPSALTVGQDATTTAAFTGVRGGGRVHR